MQSLTAPIKRLALRFVAWSASASLKRGGISLWREPVSPY